jgi:hypothetical protein
VHNIFQEPIPWLERKAAQWILTVRNRFSISEAAPNSKDNPQPKSQQHEQSECHRPKRVPKQLIRPICDKLTKQNSVYS